MAAVRQAHDILSPEFARDPYPSYRAMRDGTPLLWHETLRSYVLSRYEDVERAFKESVFTSDNYVWQIEPVHGRTIIQMSGGEHAVRRALVAPALRGTALRETLLPLIEENSRRLIDGFRAAGSVELVGQYADLFPVNVLADMVGLDRADHATFHGWSRAINAYVGNLTGDREVAAAGERTRREFAAYVLPLIRDRRARPRGDLLSALCAAEVEGTAMSDDDIRAFCSLLLAAGGDTTGKAIASLFAGLLRHPDQLAAVRSDHGLIERALAETLRHTPPVHMIMRQAAADVRVSGGVIPGGSTVTCLIGSAGRDERRYADPDRFDIFRDDLSATTAFSAAADHLAFTVGRHFCVGALLAKAEVEVGVGQLLDAMPGVRLAEGARLVERGVFARGPAAVPLRFDVP